MLIPQRSEHWACFRAESTRLRGYVEQGMAAPRSFGRAVVPAQWYPAQWYQPKWDNGATNPDLLRRVLNGLKRL